jgi:hypothetical protein
MSEVHESADVQTWVYSADGKAGLNSWDEELVSDLDDDLISSIFSILSPDSPSGTAKSTPPMTSWQPQVFHA